MVTFNIIIDAKVVGTQFDDFIVGRGGSDLIVGRDGDDTIVGNARSDILLGNHGSDVLLGRGGRDLLHGGADNDVLFGGMGADTLSGDFGRDVLTGGLGGDIFAFFSRTDDTTDVITDYDGGDSLMLIGYEEGSVEVVQRGADAFVIAFDSEGHHTVAKIIDTLVSEVDLAYAASNPF